jgi:hypothetical protein
MTDGTTWPANSRLFMPETVLACERMPLPGPIAIDAAPRARFAAALERSLRDNARAWRKLAEV